jgi:hypothetical protein
MPIFAYLDGHSVDKHGNHCAIFTISCPFRFYNGKPQIKHWGRWKNLNPKPLTKWIYTVGRGNLTASLFENNTPLDFDDIERMKK